jgi:hypothetical protein
MSNRAYFIGSQNSTPAGRSSDGSTNYDERTEVLADGGGYQLPVFWLSLFSVSDIRVHQFDDYRVSTLVCDRASALDNLHHRRASVLAAFPRCDEHWEVWRKLVEGSTAPYFKVDATEIWDLEPDLYERDFAPAVRWFASLDPADFAILLSVGILDFNPETRRFTVGGAELKGEHLYGYRMNASPPPAPPPPPVSMPTPPRPPIPPPPPPAPKKPWWKLFS